MAKAYNRGLALEKAGDVNGAVKAYRDVLALEPADPGGAAIRLAALRQGAVPQCAPAAYVEMLFDQQAEAFEYILVDQLQYGVPAIIAERLLALRTEPFANMLDLGCGTGLCGQAMKDRAGTMTGIDLSENMVSIAYDKDIYDNLYVAEVIDYLAENDESPFDLVIAADVLPYLGKLDAFCAHCANNLAAGGFVAVSTETLTENAAADYEVTAHHRYAHRRDYVSACLKANGFTVVQTTPVNVRMQDNAPTPGDVVIAQIPK